MADPNPKLGYGLKPPEGQSKAAAGADATVKAAAEAADAVKVLAAELVKVKPAAAAATAAFDALKAGLGGLKTAAGAVGGLFDALKGKLAEVPATLGKAAEKLAGPMAALNSAVGTFQSQVVSLVATFNPGEVRRFEYAWRDLQAVLGEALTPILKAGTAAVRGLADTLNGLGGEGKAAIQALIGGAVALTVFKVGVLAIQTALTGGLMPVIAAVVGGAVGIMAASGKLTPILDALRDTLGGVLTAAGQAVMILANAARPLFGVLRGVADLFGKLFAVGAGVAASLAPAIEGIAKALMDALGEAQEPIAELADALGGLLVGAIKAITPVVVAVADGIGTAVRAIAKVMTWLTDQIRWLAEKVGYTIPRFDLPDTTSQKSDGKSVLRNPTTGDVSALLTRVREQAYALASTPENQTAKNTARMADQMDKLVAFAGEIAKQGGGAGLSGANLSMTPVESPPPAAPQAPRRNPSFSADEAGRYAAWASRQAFG